MSGGVEGLLQRRGLLRGKTNSATGHEIVKGQFGQTAQVAEIEQSVVFGGVHVLQTTATDIKFAVIGMVNGQFTPNKPQAKAERAVGVAKLLVHGVWAVIAVRLSFVVRIVPE